MVPNHAYWPAVLRHETSGVRRGAPSWNRTNLLRASTGSSHQCSYRSNARQPVGESNPYPEIERLRSCTVRRTGHGAPRGGGATDWNRTSFDLLTREVPHLQGPDGAAAARAGVEPAVVRLTGGCLTTWLPCNMRLPADWAPHSGERVHPRAYVSDPVELSKSSSVVTDKGIRGQDSNLRCRVQSPESFR